MRIFVLIPVYSCLLISTGVARIIQNVVAETKYGQVLGQRRQEDYDIGEGAVTDTVDQFLGVPYARPPVGPLRFQPPQPPLPWPGVRNTTSPAWVCPQVVYYTQTNTSLQSEDCLYLNVYTPVQHTYPHPGLPVMLFIHGGSYEEGAGSRYDGFTLAQHGVVVVTINYRLGLLGYLTSGDGRLRGNYGLQDQIEAVRWVAENIAHFRGNPGRLTLFGSSAGSSSVGLLLITPHTTGLIHQAIVQSGPPVAFWSVYNDTVDHKTFVHKVATRVGCRHDSLDEQIACLRRVPYSVFTDVHWKFPRIVPSNLNFKPRVDGDILPEFPATALTSGRYHNISLMAGVVTDEWARSMGFFFRELNDTDMDSDLRDGFERRSLERSIRHVITQRFWWPQQVADVILHAYTDWRRVRDPYANRRSYVDFMSDFAMVAPTVDLVRKVSVHGTPVHLYQYNHTSTHTRPAWWGCYHSLELDAVFGSPFTGYNIAVDREANHTEADRKLSRDVMKLWTNFAKYGHPTPRKHRGNLPHWRSFNSTKLNYLYLSANHTSMRHHLRADKMALWNQLIPRLVMSIQHPFVMGQTTAVRHHTTLSWILVAVCIALLVGFFAILAIWIHVVKQQRSNSPSVYYSNGNGTSQMI